MKEIKRVFSYHGAEHKTINSYESNIPLTVDNVKESSLYHPRCGTGFVIILVVFSVILFTLVGPLPNILIKFLSRIVLLPLLVMVSYEYMRFSATHINHPVFRYLSFINMTMQKLTTNEPSQDMLEVAITAFNKMYEMENSNVDAQK